MSVVAGTPDAVAVGVTSQPQEFARERGYWSSAWFELRHDWSAMIGLAIVLVLVVAAVFAPLLAPYSPFAQFQSGLTLSGNPLAPSAHYLLGTDALGRDELSRLLYGARISITVGIGSTLIAGVMGLAFGGVAGLVGGWRDKVLMRLADVIISFPILLLATAVLSVSQPGVATISIVVGLGFGAYLSRVVYAQAVTLRERDFVLAASTSGVKKTKILLRHIVPHVLPSIIVFCTLSVATAIQLEAALSFVGIGIRPPTASWGNMIFDGENYMTIAPWLVFFPALAILLAMVGFSLLGDGLRDALDPTLERSAQLRLEGFR